MTKVSLTTTRYRVTPAFGAPSQEVSYDTGLWTCDCGPWQRALKGSDGFRPDCEHIEVARLVHNGSKKHTIVGSPRHPVGAQLTLNGRLYKVHVAEGARTW